MLGEKIMKALDDYIKNEASNKCVKLIHKVQQNYKYLISFFNFAIRKFHDQGLYLVSLKPAVNSSLNIDEFIDKPEFVFKLKGSNGSGEECPLYEFVFKIGQLNSSLEYFNSSGGDMVHPYWKLYFNMVKPIKTMGAGVHDVYRNNVTSDLQENEFLLVFEDQVITFDLFVDISRDVICDELSFKISQAKNNLKVMKTICHKGFLTENICNCNCDCNCNKLI